MRITFLFVALACGCVTAKPAPPDPTPLVEPTPQPPDETPQIREVIEAFLSVRWTFDYEAMNAFVTPQDAAEPWHDPMEEEVAKMRHADARRDHTWSVQGIEVDDGVATVDVELIGPGTQGSLSFQLRTSLRMIKATSRWLRDPKKKQAELKSVVPPRQVRTLTYRLHKVDGEWLVFMDWPAARQMAEAQDDEARRKMFDAFEGSEKELYARRPPLDDRARKLVKAVDEAERAVRDRDFKRARELYDVLLVSDAAIPDFLAARRDDLDALEVKQQRKLAEAKVEVGPLREVDQKHELRVKNEGRDLRSFRLIAEYVDTEGEHSYRAIHERQLPGGESRTVLVYARRGQQPTAVRLVEVKFLDRDFEAQFRQESDERFEMQLRDLRTNGEARTSADRIARVVDDHRADFDACAWPADADPVDIWIEVEHPPRARVVRALLDPSDDLGACLAKTAATLEYPDAEHNRSVVRVYPPKHWWRLNE